MSGDLSPGGRVAVKLDADLLSCTVCRDPFSIGGEKGPCSLSCGHSFCRGCLRSVRAAGEMKCPTCRKVRARRGGGRACGVVRGTAHLVCAVRYHLPGGA